MRDSLFGIHHATALFQIFTASCQLFIIPLYSPCQLPAASRLLFTASCLLPAACLVR